EIYNTDNGYSNQAGPPPGYGQSIYTDYGYTRTGSGVVTNGAFYESTAYYINTNWAAPTNSSVPAFWIDTTPSNDPNYLDETNFQVYVSGSGVVQVGSAETTDPLVNIATSGWYTFKTTFQEARNGTVMNIMSVINPEGRTIA